MKSSLQCLCLAACTLTASAVATFHPPAAHHGVLHARHAANRYARVARSMADMSPPSILNLHDSLLYGVSNPFNQDAVDYAAELDEHEALRFDLGERAASSFLPPTSTSSKRKNPKHKPKSAAAASSPTVAAATTNAAAPTSLLP